jgi:hypothetical protein
MESRRILSTRVTNGLHAVFREVAMHPNSNTGYRNPGASAANIRVQRFDPDFVAESRVQVLPALLFDRIP